MLSPCACVGTNQWVHEDCVKEYCLQHLSSREPTSRDLMVVCPICKTLYNITETPKSSSSQGTSTWRDLTQWTTDRQLLLRHVRFLLLVMPVVCSALVTWSQLIIYWRDLYMDGPGEPLLDGNRFEPPLALELAADKMSMLHEWLVSAVLWLPAQAIGALEELSPSLFQQTADDNANWQEVDLNLEPDSGLRIHPAGISKRWSALYVWLQHVQWYKVLCWLLTMVIGGAEGALPATWQDMFRVDELLLASERRAHIFLTGQCTPFVLTKLRHFLVSWARASSLTRFLFYSVFTSHVEVCGNTLCDTVSAALFARDWILSASNDLALRRNIIRLRQGNFRVAPYSSDRHLPGMIRPSVASSEAPAGAARHELLRRRHVEGQLN